MINRVRIQGYKSLSDFEVDLMSLSVVFGPNAAGKSNFLDALHLLARMVSMRSLADAFEAPHRGTPLESFSFGIDGIPGHLEKESLRFSIEVDLTLSEQSIKRVEKRVFEQRRGVAESHSRYTRIIKNPNLRYRLKVEIVPKTGVLRVVDEFLCALNQDGTHKKSRRPFLEKKGMYLHLRGENRGHPVQHEIGLDHTIASQSNYEAHYPHLAGLREELAGWSFFYFEPRERMRARSPVKEVRSIGLMGEDLAAFLNTLKAKNRRQFDAIGRALHSLIPRIDGLDVEVNRMGEIDLIFREGDTLVPGRLVSEGTLRLLGLLAVASSPHPATLVAFEEPENGIHPRRIRMLAEFLQTQAEGSHTQFIVTTHSSVLIDNIGDGSLIVATRRNGSTVFARFAQSLPLLRGPALEEGLNHDDSVSVSNKLLRGDFDE